MLRSIFDLSFLLLAVLIITTAPIHYVDADCIEVPVNYVRGQCTVSVTWNKVTLYEVDYRESREGIIEDWLQANIWDPLQKQISNNLYTNCRGYPGTECNFTSGLPHVLKISPQHRREYLQFWYGDSLGWNTDPEPMLGPTFVGESEAKGRTPYCPTYTDWNLLPYDSPDGKKYLSDPNGTVNTIHRREVQCIFDCGLINFDDSWIKPYRCAPPEPVNATTVTETSRATTTKMKTKTETETRISTSVKIHTRVKYTLETVTASIGHGPVRVPIHTTTSNSTTTTTSNSTPTNPTTIPTTLCTSSSNSTTIYNSGSNSTTTWSKSTTTNSNSTPLYTTIPNPTAPYSNSTITKSNSIARRAYRVGRPVPAIYLDGGED
ncbi:hypothetical protein TWF506_011219 [Arthrobotrys conoides]|uniref:Uncharacterized protein n=1 Tax=Arthrobotrys conoides TaxID=74498 RepID=A0AAN8NQB7_9PEZI